MMLLNKYKQVLVIIFLTLVLLLVLNILTPIVYSKLPNDYVRTGMMLESLEKKEYNPEVVVFGNSRGMSGINANAIKDSTGLSTMNFCSPSQSLMESVCYYDYLPESVRYVIQCLDEREFNDLAMHLTEQAKVAFSMNNYQPLQLATQLLDKNELSRLNENSITRNLRVRSALKTGLSNIIVRKLDDDAPSDMIKDMYFPYMYPSDHSATYERDLEHLLQWVPDSDFNFAFSEELVNFCQTITHFLNDKGITLVFMVMPLCPDILWPDEAVINFKNSVESSLSSMSVLDCFDALPSEGFYDPVHPNRIGSRVLSNYISNYLKDKGL